MAEQIQIGIPINLLVYKPQQQTTALCWQINPESIVNLSLLDFEVEIDVVNSFDSINKKVYTKDTIVNYQDGTFFKAFVIDDPLLFETQNYFWRVRVNSETYISYWSDAQRKDINIFINDLQYNIPVRIQHVGSGDSELVIEKIYTTMYALNGVVYSEEDFIQKLNDDYNKTIFFGDLQYDIDKTIDIGNDESIVVRMIHQARYNIYKNGEMQEDYLTEQELTETLSNNYGITNSVYEYIGPQEFNIKNITWYEDTETAENLLPDNYVYTKTGNTNIKRIIEMYMRLIGIFKNEAVQVANNYNYEKTQDKDLYDMLGCLLEYTRNVEEPFITYKYELLNLWKAYLHQGTIEAFNIIIAALYGVIPKIEILKDKIEETWYLYEQMQLLSIDGSTPVNLNINKGDAFYNADLDKIIIATQGSTTGDWSNVYEQEPNEMTTYQVMENNELQNYQYIATSNGFYEGTPNVQRYYLTDEIEESSYLPNPYLYTNQYLAHNLVIIINNYYKRQLDQKVLMEILNNLKPLNVNIVLYINDFAKTYSYGSIGYYGNPNNYWGGIKN